MQTIFLQYWSKIFSLQRWLICFAVSLSFKFYFLNVGTMECYGGCFRTRSGKCYQTRSRWRSWSPGITSTHGGVPIAMPTMVIFFSFSIYSSEEYLRWISVFCFRVFSYKSRFAYRGRFAGSILVMVFNTDSKLFI